MAVAAAASLAAAAGASADPRVGPKVFEFSATCSGVGSVISTNLRPARADSLQVVGTTTVVLNVTNGAPGILRQALAAGRPALLRAAARRVIEPFDPITLPVVIVNG